MKHFARIVLALSLALAPMAFLGGCENWQRSVESRKQTVRDGLAALREMVFETMQDRIGKLAENRAFYCRKGHWPWMGHMLDEKELCLSRFDVVKTDEDPPDDGLFGNELIDLLRKCTTGDAVSFESISNRIVNTVGLTWIGKDGSSLAGIAAITSEDVYFIYTEMELFEGPGQPFGVFEVLKEPPYYMWRHPYWALFIRLAEQKRLRTCEKRSDSESSKVYDELSELSLRVANLMAFRMNISHERFQKGCVRISEPIENDLASLRGMVLETIKDQIGKLAEDRDFYCRVPVLPRRELGTDDFYTRFGVVKPGVDSSDDVRLGEEIMDSLRKCTLGDAVSFESISNRIVNTVGLAWIGNDGSSLAGMAAITSDEVYFVYTVMGLVTEKTVSHETYDKQFRSRPPYYAWRDSGLAQHIWLADEKRLRVCRKRIYSKLEKMYPDSRSLRKSFLFAKSITAFRIDIAPEKFQAARRVCQESTKEVETK